MEKRELVNFIVTLLEESGFKVYKDFKAFQHVIDIYAVLPTIIGDFTTVITCKNYEKEWKVGLDIVKEMERVGRGLKASKVVVVSTSYFSPQAKKYASEKKIKLIDRNNIIIFIKKFSIEDGPHYYEKNKYNNENRRKSYDNENTRKNYDNNSKIRDLKTMPKNQNNTKQYENRGISLKKKESSPLKIKKKSKPDLFRFKTNEDSNVKTKLGTLTRKESDIIRKKPNQKVKRLFNNIIVLIFLVVAISYLISLIIQQVANVPGGIQGIVKILSSLILSYGLVFIINPKGTAILFKGTLIFFISLVITVLMIILF